MELGMRRRIYLRFGLSLIYCVIGSIVGSVVGSIVVIGSVILVIHV